MEEPGAKCCDNVIHSIWPLLRFNKCNIEIQAVWLAMHVQWAFQSGVLQISANISLNTQYMNGHL